MENMNIVQIGANTGNDRVYGFINSVKDKIAKAVLVEPIFSCINPLTLKYKHIPTVFIENAAIVTDPALATTIMYYERGSNFEVSSIKKEHLLGHGAEEQNILVSKVNTLTFTQLMDKYSLSELDHLYIDAEGCDYEIIKSIDFNQFKIKSIYYESCHVDGVRQRGDKYNELVQIFASHGYHHKNYNTTDSIATLK
jgi:FkbM family methyltransferase